MGQIPERSTKHLLLYLINIFCRSLIKLPIYPAVIAQQFKGLQIKQTDGLPVILAVYGTPDLCIKIDSVNGILRVRYGNFPASESLFEELAALQTQIRKGGDV